MMQFIHYCTVSGNTVREFFYGQDESHPACVSLKLALSEKISELCGKGIHDFFTNCEYGVPLWAAEAIVAMRGFSENPCRVHIIMPYEEQALTWHSDVRERFYDIHAAADSVTMMNTRFTDDCYRETDEFMLKRSVMLLTVGGNKPALTYAKSKGKHIEHIKALALL
jgi:uncharacterized phage-like protein YoqJ